MTIIKVILVACLALYFMLLPPPAFARTVSDQLGREVKIPENPQRLVTLAASLTEIVFALNQEHRLVGVEQFSNYPAAAENLPKVGSYISPDVERIVALRPDLCLAIKDGNPRHRVEWLESLGIPVYAVDPRNLEGVIATVYEIGHLLNAGDQAEALAKDLFQRRQHIISLVGRSVHRPRVFLQIGISPIVSAGSHTFLDELITTAGGVNLTAGKVPYPRFSQEQVLALQPEVIIITSMTRGEIFERVKAFWHQWSTLPAARDNRIYLVDSDIVDRPSPRIFAGLEALFGLLHPELAGGLQ
ncbi:MAG TPA: cobalamin-binding protein [Desulfobacterales bacterium]|nr:cobalamin-binding protein [Desulfobacterales bacterium]